METREGRDNEFCSHGGQVDTLYSSHNCARCALGFNLAPMPAFKNKGAEGMSQCHPAPYVLVKRGSCHNPPAEIFENPRGPKAHAKDGAVGGTAQAGWNGICQGWTTFISGTTSWDILLGVDVKIIEGFSDLCRPIFL